LMLGLKPLERPYSGAYQPTSDTHNSAFYHERIEGESWYIYAKYDSDWNWIMEAIQFLQKHFDSKAAMFSVNEPLLRHWWTTIERYPLFSDIETVFVLASDFAKLYNEGKS